MQDELDKEIREKTRSLPYEGKWEVLKYVMALTDGMEITKKAMQVQEPKRSA